MVESKDPAITLFGKKIQFRSVSEKKKKKSDGEGEEDDKHEENKDASTEKRTEVAERESPESPEKKNNDNHQNSLQDSESGGGDEEEDDDSQENNNNNNNNNNEQTGKPLKKPTKILPCPRCNSMDTKFCYYNNYNVNQPRHFCKACQRYWTAGGTMRNVPVGAGRRKNKNSTSHYRHITISEALQAARIDPAHPGLKTSGRVLSFGLEAHHAPICDSMASVLKLGDQNKVLNGFHGLRDQRLVARIENVDDCSSRSSVTASHSHSTEESRTRNCRVPEAHMTKNNDMNMNMNGVACVPSVPWPYAWNPAIPPPGFYPPPPAFPMPFYPYWSVPMLSPQSSSSSQKGSSSSSGQNSPTLGKHSRDEDTGKNDESRSANGAAKQRNGCVLVPKTLRIDDPNEAAKSSIWTTLGIKNDAVSKGGMFRGFDQKTKKGETAETFPVLHANPAALSRSIDFHERV